VRHAVAARPVAGRGAAHVPPEGEAAVARATQHARIPYGISTLGTVAVEEVAAATSAPLWFQLYVWGDRSESKDALRRARAAGYRALLVSVDTTVRSKREREVHAGLSLPTPELSLGTLLDGAVHPRWSWRFLTSDAITFPNIGHGARSRAKVEEMLTAP
jgi:L-lactate dehydrogenase (cytochrome)